MGYDLVADLIDQNFSGDLDWESLNNYSFVNPRLPASDIMRLQALVEAVSPQFRSHIFILSSGTTNSSVQDFKWIALSKSAFLTSASEVNRHLGSGQSSNRKDICLHVLPDFHVGGLSILARSYLSGASVVRLLKWNVREFESLIIERKVTLTSLVPAQIFDLVQCQIQCPVSMRAVLVGGGALTVELYKKGRALGWPLLATYGMTEACSQIATSELDANYRLPEIGFSPDLVLLPHWDVRSGAPGEPRGGIAPTGVHAAQSIRKGT